MGKEAIVYGSSTCPKCDALKAQLQTIGCHVVEKDPRWLMDPGLNTEWRENGSASRMAWLVLQGWDMKSVPVLEADGRIFDLSKATTVNVFDKVIRLDTEECEGGACTIASPSFRHCAVAVA